MESNAVGVKELGIQQLIYGGKREITIGKETRGDSDGPIKSEEQASREGTKVQDSKGNSGSLL